jgi:tRNA(Ile)-lysidine synthase
VSGVRIPAPLLFLTCLLMKSNFKNRFLEFSLKKKLFEPGDKVLATVSGGVDSMVLLQLLLTCRRALKITLGVVHLNHKIRGEAAEKDQQLVREFCQFHNLPFFGLNEDVVKYAQKNKLSVEEAGHIIRKVKFEQIAEANGYSKIATGHHLDDQAETVLMRLIKGTGLNGLSAIRLKSGKCVRPLLFASRGEILEYAQNNQIFYNEDLSNRDIKILRNRIRFQLLPLLKQDYNSRISEHLSQLSSILEEWDDYLNSEVEKAEKDSVKKISQNKFEVGLSLFKFYFSWIIIKVIENMVERITGEYLPLNYSKFSDLMDWVHSGHIGSKFALSAEVMVVKRTDKIIFFESEPGTPKAVDLEVDQEKEYTIPFSRMKIKLSSIEPNEVYFNDDRNDEFIDGSKLEFPLQLRNWQASDRFIPLGLEQPKLVSDFLTDRKINHPEKEKIMVLINKNEIVAIPGVQISHAYRVKRNSKRVYHLMVKNG